MLSVLVVRYLECDGNSLFSQKAVVAVDASYDGRGRGRVGDAELLLQNEKSAGRGRNAKTGADKSHMQPTMQPKTRQPVNSVEVVSERVMQIAHFQQLEGSGGEGGFEPPVQLLTVQQFSNCPIEGYA